MRLPAWTKSRVLRIIGSRAMSASVMMRVPDQAAGEARRHHGRQTRRLHPRQARAGGRVSALTWKREGADWILLMDRRRFGRVVPDDRHPACGVRSCLEAG